MICNTIFYFELTHSLLKMCLPKVYQPSVMVSNFYSNYAKAT